MGASKFGGLAGSVACLADSEACLAGSEACLAGSEDCLAGSEACLAGLLLGPQGGDKWTNGQKIPLFYRPLSPIGAAAQKDGSFLHVYEQS